MEDLWNQAKEELRHNIKPIFYDKFISNIRLVQASEHGLVLEAENNQIQSHVETRYLADINRVLTQLNGSALQARFFKPGERLKQATPRVKAAPKTAPKIFSPSEPRKASLSLLDEDTINPRYTFDEFICGNSNKLAFEASRAVAQGPGTTYNPLYIFGKPGLGKTHLLHSVANALRTERPWMRIVCLQLDTFQSLWIEAIKQKNPESFKAKMRSVDVLLIDDIHSLTARATNTGEELFNTFNYLHSLNKQILLTSDRTPTELQIEERLRSRFGWGLIAELTPPQFETRRIILEKKADRLGLNLDGEVLDYLAEHIATNIRFLEAAINKLQAQAKLTNSRMDLNLAIQVARAIISHSPQSVTYQIEAILQAVCKVCQVNEFDLLSKKREKGIAQARHLGMYLAAANTDLSKKEIARKFGKSDHTTVLHAVKKVENLLQTDPHFRTLCDEVIHELKQIM